MSGGILEFCPPRPTTWMNLLANGERKKSDTKEYIMYDSICRKCKNRTYRSLGLKVRIVVALEYIVTGKEQKRGLGGATIIFLFLDLCAAYTGVFSL